MGPAVREIIPWHLVTRSRPAYADVFQVSSLDGYTAAAFRTLGAGMQRREFIGLIGGAAFRPLAARGEQSRRVPVVGILWHAGSAEEEAAFSRPLPALQTSAMSRERQ
jgi:hypothetical protein